MENRPFRRANYSAQIYGVCAGLAYYLDVHVIIVRAIMLVLVVVTFPVVFLIYIGLALTTPKWDIEPDDMDDIIHGNIDI